MLLLICHEFLQSTLWNHWLLHIHYVGLTVTEFYHVVELFFIKSLKIFISLYVLEEYTLAHWHVEELYKLGILVVVLLFVRTVSITAFPVVICWLIRSMLKITFPAGLFREFWLYWKEEVIVWNFKKSFTYIILFSVSSSSV